MNELTQSLTLTGEVIGINEDYFTVKCTSCEEIQVYLASHTSFQVVKNLGGLDSDQIEATRALNSKKDVIEKMKCEIRVGDMLVVEGIEQSHDGDARFDAQKVHVLRLEENRVKTITYLKMHTGG